MKYKILVAVALLATLGACSTTQSKPLTLSEKLAGKNAAERQEILRLECLNEAEWPQTQSLQYRYSHRNPGRPKGYNEEVSRMKALCREMNALRKSEIK